jgi:hypothetical protein|tara:strand:- start:262 stop:480 length:219 start_codon:yes stop_codon:yes gene_type:complete
VRNLAQQVEGLVTIHTLVLVVEARSRGGLAFGGLVEDEVDALARLNDANLEVSRTEVDADHRGIGHSHRQAQ